MNKYIKTDLENAEKYMRSAIMNALHNIDSGEEKKINLGDYISWTLFVKCLKDSGWYENEERHDTCGWECDFWSFWISPSRKNVEISGSLLDGRYKIEIEENG